jgi:hypothetical protein
MKERTTQLAATLTDDSEIVIKEIGQQFSDMIAIIASVDNLHEPMATSVINCKVWLSIYMSLKRRGVDFHE